MNDLKKIPKIRLQFNKEYNTLVCYNFIENLWMDKIAVYKDKLVTNSNHFITVNDSIQEDGIDKRNPKNSSKPHYIFSRIVKNYNKIINSKNNLIINDKCIFLHNSWSSGNAGHELFEILNILKKYKHVNDVKFVIFEEINNNNTQIINLFIKPEKLIKIKSGIVYNFKNQIFDFEEGKQNCLEYKKIINELREKIDTDFNLKNKKVIIIKNTNNKKVVRKRDCFDADILFDYLKEKGWYICDVENDNLKKMAHILMHASVILTSQRGISCFNQIFYNLNNDCKIIGFMVNENNDNIYITKSNNNHKDFMCNELYFHKMEKIIYSPLKIKLEHAKDIEKLVIGI